MNYACIRASSTPLSPPAVSLPPRAIFTCLVGSPAQRLGCGIPGSAWAG